MGLFVSPILEDKLDKWKSWASAFKSSKKAEFDDLNKRYGITRHEAWLVETPNGPLAVVLQEGPGVDTFMQKVIQSEHSFDKEFVKSIAELHGMDPKSPPPGPLPVKVL
jgi:hypothetical protein